MSSQRNWTVAQRLAARMLARVGVAVAIAMLLAFFLLAHFGKRDENTLYSVGVWAGIAITPAFGWIFYRVENCLKELDAQTGVDPAASDGGER